MLHSDDRLHPLGDDDMWFESYWFAFYVPEQLLTVYIYPWFRPNLGVFGGGVLAWDDKGTLPWSILHHDYTWSGRFAGEASMIDGDVIATPQGVRIHCLAPAERYRITYDHPDFAFDVTYEATGPASHTAAATAEQDIFKGHIDQPGRYRGWVRSGSDRFDVDCHCVRDRSWGPRRDDALNMHIGYYHATASDQDAFLLVGHEAGAHDSFAFLSGYLIRDGVHAPLVEGKAVIQRGGDLAPKSCHIEARDSLGRALRADGRGLAAVALQQQPGMFNWSSLAQWRFSDVEAYGELQDTWHPDKYRQFVRGNGA